MAIVSDTRYRFRADLPGILAPRADESERKTGPLIWRSYSSHSPTPDAKDSYTASVKVFETDSTDARMLFEAGENDATQALAMTLIGRRDGVFGTDKRPSMTLWYQNGRDGAADTVRATVLLVVAGRRLYILTFAFHGLVDQTARATRFFQSFEILK